MDAQNKLADVEEMFKALDEGRATEVYDFMKTMDHADYPKYNDFAKEKGFKDFQEMICFFTLGDANDDAPGCELRNNQRRLLEIALKHYTDKADATGTAKSDENSFGSMLQSAALPIAFAIVALIVWMWTQTMAVLIIVAMALIWIAIQLGSAYQAGPGEQRIFDLFQKYGVHSTAPASASKIEIKKEDAVQTPASESESEIEPEPSAEQSSFSEE